MSLPSVVTELIEEYKDNTFRIPKNVSSIQLSRLPHNGEKREIVELSITSGVWVVERLMSPSPQAPVFVTIVLRKSNYIPTTSIQAPLPAQESHGASMIENMVICAGNSPIFSINVFALTPTPIIYQNPNMIVLPFLFPEKRGSTRHIE